jgi:hypothetical protein
VITSCNYRGCNLVVTESVVDKINYKDVIVYVEQLNTHYYKSLQETILNVYEVVAVLSLIQE